MKYELQTLSNRIWKCLDGDLNECSEGREYIVPIVIYKKGADIKFKIIPFELLDRQSIFLFGGNTRSKWITAPFYQEKYWRN